MFKNLFYPKSLKFKIPQNWNDLSNKQLIKIATLFFSNHKNEPFRDYKLFKIMANYQWYKPLLLRKIILLFKLVSITELKTHFDFVFTKQNLTRFIPVIKIKSVKYFAPADRLTNISIGEFSVCEDLYLGYLRNQKNPETNFGESYLNYLFAVLYIQSNNTKRPHFEKENLERFVEATENVSKKYLLTTLLSYKGCREAITSNPKYKHVFPKPKANESTPETEKKEPVIPASSGFSEVILSFSGKLFGDYDKTFNTNIYTFLDAYENTLQTLKNQ